MRLLKTAAASALLLSATSFARHQAQTQHVVYTFVMNGKHDTYDKATSVDGVNWVEAKPAPTWSTCANGTPCRVNAPSPLCVKGVGAACTGGQMYIVIAYANDEALLSSLIQVGYEHADNSVTTITTVDMSRWIHNIYTVFAPNWINDGSGCMYIPVSVSGTFTSFSTYVMCASSFSPSGVTFSPPQLVTTNGVTGGYDPAGWLIKGTYYLLQTEYVPGKGNSGFGAATCISKATNRNGPYTLQECSNQPGPQLATEPVAGMEGPNYFQTTDEMHWQFYAENIEDSPEAIREMYYTTCVGPDPLHCKAGPFAPWRMDKRYRHGVVLPPLFSKAAKSNVH